MVGGPLKGVFWKSGLVKKVHFLEIQENLEILEKPPTVENKGESDHFLEILEDFLKILEILEIEKTPFVITPFSGPKGACLGHLDKHYCRDQNYSGSEKCFQELMSEKLLIFFADGPSSEWVIIVSRIFSSFSPLAGQITGSGLKAINSSKKVLKITGPALFRINSVIISARTVCKKGKGHQNSLESRVFL